ncbi:MAG: PKD domain-containing protein [Verrucomicrobia bacterium]|nr:PKD domain-containing protein [Verrucomicrobiota bacterium]MCG2679091.1 PKD domain-containing protein [Kiritimatiellia bacterium]MBU4248425.1 PKD domain-containing protein [Verrucomicrobiota bacterium]MBU4290913.1 PKD domain-containing protein [Verrucomicrobiota bacterium]MBU4428034.1 PKD domain-containing protein [Verrucomicrobiota bacterium]
MKSTAAFLVFWVSSSIAWVEASPWHDPSASCRVRVVLATNSPWPADTGYVQVWPAGSAGSNPAVTVVSENGVFVASSNLWKTDGEPAGFLFDTSSGTSNYWIYGAESATYLHDAATSTESSWQPGAGVILETRQRTKGPMDSWSQVRQLWDDSYPVLGRSLVPDINLGIHPHGPSRNFIAFFQGILILAQGGAYQFATVSTDASFLLVDGTPVTQWPGKHDAEPGRQGEHQGTIHLEPGRHAIHYYHVHGPEHAVALAAWKPPGADRFSVIPPESFTPLAQFHVTAAESAPSKAPVVYFEWEPVSHTMVNDLALVNMRFTALPAATPAAFHWIFDDGTTATGRTVEHLFPRPGIRDVTLEVKEKTEGSSPDNSAPMRSRQGVAVHPQWTQQDERPPHLLKTHKAELTARDLNTMPMNDLFYLVRFALAIEDRPWATALGAACLERRKEWIPEHVDVLFNLGLHYQHPDVRDYSRAEALFQAMLAFQPPVTAFQDKTKLRLAELWIHMGRNPDQAVSLLGEMDSRVLTPDDQRLKKILEADTALLQGQADKAVLLYAALGNFAEKPLQTLRRRAGLESARQFLDRNDIADAAELVETIEWENPAERMSAETSLTMIAIHQARREYPFALGRCLLLLNAPSLHDKDRAEVLFKLIEIHQALGNTSLAGEVYARLLSDYPYSEAAARARDRIRK